MASPLLAGVQYPRSLGEFSAWFSTDADCLDYLEWLRWPGGVRVFGVRPRWWLAAGRWPVHVPCVRRAQVVYGGHDL